MTSAASFSRLIPVLAIVAVVAAGWWLFRNERRSAPGGTASQPLANETEAAESLRGLGAFVMLDANRQHVQSVDLRLPGVDEHLDEALQYVRQLPHLEVLQLGGTSIQDRHLADLAVHRKLTTLGLNDTDIGDEGLAHIVGLKSLVALYLSGTQITSAGLKSMDRLTGLQILDLSGTQVGSDLGSVIKLRQLQHLLLRDMRLDDATLASLSALPLLGRLTLLDAEANESALDALRQAKPNLSIDR